MTAKEFYNQDRKSLFKDQKENMYKLAILDLMEAYHQHKLKEVEYIISNNERPKEAGTYETINSADEKQDTFFDGSTWLIEIEQGQRPVKSWQPKH